jgi:hypothetical protein
MHILVLADADNFARISDYCHQYGIVMHYGRIDHELHDIAWQIIADPAPRLDILLLLFPEHLRVLC